MIYSARSMGVRDDGAHVVEIGFGDPADNTECVPAAIAAVKDLGLKGGRGILFNGKASLVVAMALAHEVAHLYQFVAMFDPKLQGYVVAISHAPEPRPGNLIA
jgi:CRISPR-associated Csx3 family protein